MKGLKRKQGGWGAPDFTSAFVGLLIVGAVASVLLWELGGWFLNHVSIGWRP